MVKYLLAARQLSLASEFPHKKASMIVHACDPNSWELIAGSLEFSGLPVKQNL